MADMVRPAGLSEAEAFMWEHAGYGYVADKQTPEEGRIETAKGLAAAEAWLQEQDGETTWEVDQDADRSGIDHDAPLFSCTVAVACKCGRRCCDGWRTTGLCGIDLGDAGDNSDGAKEYQRVVEAELAQELMEGE